MQFYWNNEIKYIICIFNKYILFKKKTLIYFNYKIFCQFLFLMSQKNDEVTKIIDESNILE